jgi:hypothetical protein
MWLLPGRKTIIGISIFLVVLTLVVISLLDMADAYEVIEVKGIGDDCMVEWCA